MSGHNCEEEHPVWRMVVSGVMLVVGLLVQWFTAIAAVYPFCTLVYYLLAFVPVGNPVLSEAWERAKKGEWASEFMLMTIASIGAFCIGEFPEAVAVMLLYAVGETLQDRAVDKARDNIRELVAIKPDHARVVKADGTVDETQPEWVAVGSVIEVRPGERVPLDGMLLDTMDQQGRGVAFDTAALTGESVPRLVAVDGEVLAGMIATDSMARIRVTRPAGQSAVARILTMVEEATARKAPTELFISRFAHVYTPVVIALAVLVVAVPWVWAWATGTFVYELSSWLHRALVFLVISCPCALVISVPLSYFAGIGLASRRGILFKGGHAVDAVAEVDTVVFDKTGTLTTGQFAVTQVVGLDEADLQAVARIERGSNHPIARAVCRYCQVDEVVPARNIPGYGLKTDEWTVGTLRLLDREGVAYPEALLQIADTLVVCARRGRYVGHIVLADTLKADAREAIAHIGARCVILSGDKQSLVARVGSQLGVDEALGDLLPQDKLDHIARLQREGHKVAFVGDGINDAPALAMANVGMAMGGLGADMAIETADIIVQTDQPSRVATAIGIGRRTRRIVRQNIVLAIGVKMGVMVLGMVGVANLWEAVFADTGVALLAVLNATRLLASRRDNLANNP
ncbi:MAG: heavy metal translocating P-type ATPase [Prevotella sp.]